MNWLTDPDRVRVQWRLVWLNLAAVLLNLVIGIGLWRMTSIANFVSAIFSGFVAWTLYKKIPEIRRREQARLIDILKHSDQNFHCIDG